MFELVNTLHFWDTYMSMKTFQPKKNKQTNVFLCAYYDKWNTHSTKQEAYGPYSHLGVISIATKMQKNETCIHIVAGWFAGNTNITWIRFKSSLIWHYNTIAKWEALSNRLVALNVSAGLLTYITYSEQSSWLYVLLQVFKAQGGHHT